MQHEDLGDRMKMYEGVEAQRRLMPLVPAIARLDGRSFSKFTRGLERPFDLRFVRLMQDVARHLVAESDANVGYCQSDEITLAWYSASSKSQIYFDGRVQKMVSTLASMATLAFNRALPHFLDAELANKWPTFDCRVWNVPTLEEASNVFVWRQADAVKNSIAMAAQHHFPQDALLGKHGGEMQELLFKERGVNWNDYDAELKRGTFVRRQIVRRRFTSSELEALPPLHDARKNPELEIERTEYLLSDLWLTKIANRADVLFFDAAPIEAS